MNYNIGDILKYSEYTIKHLNIVDVDIHFEIVDNNDGRFGILDSNSKMTTHFNADVLDKYFIIFDNSIIKRRKNIIEKL